MSKKKPLSLHVPEPEVRPGEKPNFSDMEIPVAGETRRPKPNSAAFDIQDLAHSTIRVLNDEGEAVGPWAEDLATDELIDGLKDMMKLRALDARMVVAQRQGKVSFYITALGEEAVTCAYSKALQPGDMNFPTYRQHGLLVANGYPLIDFMNQIYSNSGDPLVGRQMPVMHSAKDYGFFSVSGNLGTQFVQAVGWAMGSAIAGDTKISNAWIGDGSTAESDFHSALVFASTFQAPVILNVVNNQWAISTFQGIARGNSATFASRGIGFGIASLRVDGNDFLAVYAAAKWAAERARGGHGPTLIEHVTYRRGAHSTSDDPSAYRPREEPDDWPLGDPIDRLSEYLIAQGAWSAERQTQAQAEVEAEIIDIQKQSESFGTLQTGNKPSPKEMFEGVYLETPLHLQRQRQEAGV